MARHDLSWFELGDFYQTVIGPDIKFFSRRRKPENLINAAGLMKKNRLGNFGSHDEIKIDPSIGLSSGIAYPFVHGEAIEVPDQWLVTSINRNPDGRPDAATAYIAAIDKKSLLFADSEDHTIVSGYVAIDGKKMLVSVIFDNLHWKNTDELTEHEIPLEQATSDTASDYSLVRYSTKELRDSFNRRNYYPAKQMIEAALKQALTSEAH